MTDTSLTLGATGIPKKLHDFGDGTYGDAVYVEGMVANVDLDLEAADLGVAAEAAALGVGVLVQADDGTDRQNVQLDNATGGVKVTGTNLYTEDAAAAADPVGPALILVRQDTLAIGTVTTDGDNIAMRGTNKGQAHVKAVDSDAYLTTIAAAAGPYPVSPVMTAYTPSTTAYVKVTPDASNITMFLRPNVATEALQVASILTHKIADATTIAATVPAVSEAESYALSIELADDFGTHVVSTAYHVNADTALTTTDATSEATLVAEVNAVRAKMLSHLASTTVHGGLADATNLATVTATSDATDAASAITLENVLAGAHAAHLLVTDQNKYLVHAAGVMPMEWRCLGSFFCKTDASGHTFVTQEFRSS